MKEVIFDMPDSYQKIKNKSNNSQLAEQIHFGITTQTNAAERDRWGHCLHFHAARHLTVQRNLQNVCLERATGHTESSAAQHQAFGKSFFFFF